MREPYDVVIVGAGHNGLVAAFYLAGAGLRTVVLERRPIVGGACTTEEFAPGSRPRRARTCSRCCGAPYGATFGCESEG